jgi:hypothetical protein
MPRSAAGVLAQPGGLPAGGGVPATTAPARGKAFPPLNQSVPISGRLALHPRLGRPIHFQSARRESFAFGNPSGRRTCREATDHIRGYRGSTGGRRTAFNHAGADLGADLRRRAGRNSAGGGLRRSSRKVMCQDRASRRRAGSGLVEERVDDTARKPARHHFLVRRDR